MPNDKNKLRWDCEKQGCFNIKKRPKLEEFYDCLPGKIAFGDVDGIVEINDHYLLLEFKGDNIRLPKGQEIMYKRLTKGRPVTVWIINGDCETMHISEYYVFWNGEKRSPENITLEELKRRIIAWVQYAKKSATYSKQ